MANALYDEGRDKFVNGDIDYTNDLIRLTAVNTSIYSVDLENDEFYSSIPPSARVSAVTITGKSTSKGIVDADDSSFPSVTGAQIGAFVMDRDSGSDSSSALFAFWDTAIGLPVTPNGGDITVTWSSGTNRIFKL